MVARLMLVRMLLGAGLMAPAAAGQEERATTLPAATLPAVTSDLGSLVRFVVGDGSLGMWGTAEPPLTRVDVPGVGQATVTGRPGSFYVHVRLGPPDAGDNNTVSFRQTAAMLSVTLNVYDAQGRAQKSVTLSQAVEDPQAARQMRFVARAELRTGQSHLSLKSVSELRRGHADAYRRFLAPLWRDLGRWGVLRVDEDLAGDILADGEVDDAMRRQVERLLADLDVEDFSRRESAHKELIALGRPAVEMLRKLNTSDLTAQQQAAVQSLLQSYRGGNAEQRQRLLSDADFLLDCLYSRNPDTRQRAATGLAKLAGRPIEIDAKREPTDLADAIETLRDELVVGKALQKGR